MIGILPILSPFVGVNMDLPASTLLSVLSVTVVFCLIGIVYCAFTFIKLLGIRDHLPDLLYANCPYQILNQFSYQHRWMILFSSTCILISATFSHCSTCKDTKHIISSLYFTQSTCYVGMIKFYFFNRTSVQLCRCYKQQFNSIAKLRSSSDTNLSLINKSLRTFLLLGIIKSK